MPERAVSEFPDWLSADRLPFPLDPALYDWLYVDKGSLTRRLTDLANGAFSVTPLHEAWQPLRADECAVLNLPAGSEGWVREVYLCGHDQPWVFARSVAARAQLEESGLDLQRLGNRSLGELLFSDPAFTRGTLEACRYPAAWLPTECRAEGLWARRSCFRQNRLGVLVSEVFLSALWQAADIAP
ncbi:chorismate--pyruvate lyase family protein [Stutzerimonas stutzeri]|uniref:chorismate--pyruvate lyase family protein n=1 Tax=Stutzerimonas stutzeri TaxID=316 RepID=UPI000290E33C|nr:chorismate lyase [Stutzerimonas stutzeri]